MQNSIEKKDLEKNLEKNINTNSNTNPKKKQLLLSKINIREKPILKIYLTQYFETPQKFFVSKFKNKQIILNKFKSPLETFELPLPLRLLKRYKRRKSKAAQLFNDTTMKEQMAEMASLYNNNSKERKRLLREIAENKNKEDKREINDQEIQKMFMAFETVRKINKTRINNFITKNEYVDLMHLNKNENENAECNNNKNNIKVIDNETEKNSNNIIEEKNEGNVDAKIKKLIKSKSSFFNRNAKNDIENRIISSKINKYHEKNNNNLNNKNYRVLSMPKISSQKNRNSPVFKSIFDEINPQRTAIIKNEDYNSTLNSQYSTLYKTRNKTFRSRLKNTLNIFQKEKAKEKNDILLQKQSQYVLDINNQIFKKEILKKLVSQEKALQHNTKYNNKFSNLLNILSKNLQKEKGDLMLGQTDDYRILKDIKSKLNNLMKNVCPENHYKWENELRKEKNDDNVEYIKINNVNNHNKEITRNPYNLSNRSKNGKIFKEYDEQYIRKNVPKTAYRKFIKDINNVNSNLEGLIIEGQDLLKCEQDLIKNMKGKKVLINFKSSLIDKDCNDALYAYNIHINKYSKP